MSQKTRYYDIEGWKGKCNISADTIDKNIKIINKSFDVGGEGLKTEVLFQTQDFQLNVNYSNMVLAMCVRDVLVIDNDFDSGKWTPLEADETIANITRFCDFMHSKGVDLLFKMYRTDKGMHAILINKRVKSDTDFAIKIMVALCNDPFYTAFSRVTGFCMRIGPKVYRPSTGTSLYARVTSEIIAKEYNKPKYVGYGKPDPSIEKIMVVKSTLINFIKKSYKDNFASMTKIRYIPYIDDFRMCPPAEFLDRLVSYTKKLYKDNINNDYIEDEYVYSYNHEDENVSDIELYNQADISVSYDLYNYMWSFCINVNVAKFHHVDINKFMKVTELLHSNGKSSILISDSDKGEIILLTKSNIKDDVKLIDSNVSVDYKLCLRVSPVIKFDNKGNLIIDDITIPIVVSDIVNNKYISIGEDNREIITIFNIMKSFRDYLYELYEHDDEMVTKRLYRQKKTHSYGPSLDMMAKVKDTLLDIIDDNEAKKPEKITNKFKHVHSIRYGDIIPMSEVKECYKTINDVHNQAEMLRPYVLKDCGNNFVQLSGPEYPFVYGQSQYANMIFVATYDILMLDWDVKLGITKETAVEILERFLLSQSNLPENMRLFLKEPCFKIYETDNGVHAYLISELVSHNSDIASKIMIEVCSDINYAAMTRFKGYSIRLSPKIFIDKNYVDVDYLDSQFIQEEGMYVNGEMVHYLGNEENIDPYILEFVDIIYKTQKHILTYDKDIIYDTLLKRNKDVISEWGDFLANKYNKMKNSIGRQKNAKLWSMNSDNCDYIRNVNLR